MEQCPAKVGMTSDQEGHGHTTVPVKPIHVLGESYFPYFPSAISFPTL